MKSVANAYIEDMKEIIQSCQLFYKPENRNHNTFGIRQLGRC